MSEKEYVVDDSDLLVLLSDQIGNFLYANPAYLKASGYTWDELKGSPAARMMDKENPVQISTDMILTIRGKQPWTGLIKNRRKTGEYYWLRLNISPIFSGGKYAGSLMVHSRPSREELERIEPLYRKMLDGQHKNLMLRHGRAFRATRLGKLIQGVRELGLMAPVWGAMAVLNLVVFAGLLAAGSSMASWSFWGAMAAFTGVTGAVGTYLFRSIVLPMRGAARFANQIAAGDL